MNDQDRPSNLPTFLVVLLAAVGLMALPQSPAGRGGASQGRASSTTSEVTSGHAASTDAGDEKCPNLALLNPLKEYWHRYNSCDHPSRECLLSRTHRLRFLTVTVPDPDGTSMSYQFDSVVVALQRAAERQGYIAEYRDFPWKTDEARKVQPAREDRATKVSFPGGLFEFTISKAEKTKTRRPGSILFFRRLSDELLLAMLIPETPNAGVDKESLGRALEVSKDYGRWHKHCSGCKGSTASQDSGIRIVGPMYSGSFDSLGMTIEGWVAGDMQLLRSVTIFNGSALVRPHAPEKNPGGDFWSQVRWASMLHDNGRLVEELVKFLDSTSPPRSGPRRVALLIEGGTAFGNRPWNRPGNQTPRELRPDVFVFPLGISRMRQEYTAKGVYAAKEPLQLAAPERLSLQSLTGTSGDHDLMPIYTPGTAIVEGEMVLSQILQELERGEYTSIGIIASSDYDRIFLATKIREVCPDVRLTFTASTSLYTHHNIVPYLRGSVVVSTYPLRLANQWWTQQDSTDNNGWIERQPHVAFPHDYTEGVCNAVLAHLSEMENDGTTTRTAPLLDYGFPGGAVKGSTVSPVWISVVGQRGLYPLKVVPGDSPAESYTRAERDGGRGLYKLKLAKDFQDDLGKTAKQTAARLDPNWVVLFLVVALVEGVGAAWYLAATRAARGGSIAHDKWLGWLRMNPDTVSRISSPAGRRLAVLALSSGLGLLLLVGLPAWEFAILLPSALAGQLTGVVTIVVGASSVGIGLWVVWGAVSELLNSPEPRGLSELVSWAVAIIVPLVPTLVPLFMVIFMMPALDRASDPVLAANLRLDCDRMARLTDGVTPLVPILLLGLAAGVAVIAGWRRLGILERIQEVGLPDATRAEALGGVRDALDGALHLLDAPLSSGCRNDSVVALAVVASVPFLLWMVASPPVSLERWPLYVALMLALLLTLYLVWLRLIELIGLWRATSRLLRSIARLPMVKAFDRLPSGAVAAGPTEHPTGVSGVARNQSDAFIDEQFRCLDTNYPGIWDTPRATQAQDAFNGRDCTFQEFLQRLSDHASGSLLLKLWWRAVEALIPDLAASWAGRSVATSQRNATAERKEWPGHVNPGRPDASGSHGDEEGMAPTEHPGEGRPPIRDGRGERSRSAVEVTSPGATTATRVRGRKSRSQAEESRCRIGDAEVFVALVLAREVCWLRRACWSLVTAVVVGLICLSFTMTSYPFQPQGRVLAAVGVLSVTTVAVVLTIAVQSSRDEVISRMTHTIPNRLTLDREFLTKLVTFGVPLLGVLLTVSYGISDLIRSWFEPLFR